jgi:DNA-directed RNA polymerase subunit E'/Rpb7
MATVERRRNPTTQNQQQAPKLFGVYIPSVLTLKICLPITDVGKNIKQNLETTISRKTQGRCITEGYVKPGSIRILSYSAGNVNGDIIEFQAVFECMICNPVEGMNMNCTVKTITKAGIHAEVVDDKGNIPVTVFIARDYHYSDKLFNSVKDGEKITARVIGVRYELNDPYICVIAKIIEQQTK